MTNTAPRIQVDNALVHYLASAAGEIGSASSAIKVYDARGAVGEILAGSGARRANGTARTHVDRRVVFEDTSGQCSVVAKRNRAATIVADVRCCNRAVVGDGNGRSVGQFTIAGQIAARDSQCSSVCKIASLRDRLPVTVKDRVAALVTLPSTAPRASMVPLLVMLPWRILVEALLRIVPLLMMALRPSSRPRARDGRATCIGNRVSHQVAIRSDRYTVSRLWSC